jgi:hypothetical protein
MSRHRRRLALCSRRRPAGSPSLNRPLSGPGMGTPTIGTSRSACPLGLAGNVRHLDDGDGSRNAQAPRRGRAAHGSTCTEAVCTTASTASPSCWAAPCPMGSSAWTCTSLSRAAAYSNGFWGEIQRLGGRGTQQNAQGVSE